MARIRKRIGKKTGSDGKTRKTTNWQAVVRRGDHKAQYRTFATKGEADSWATSVENAINHDEFTPAPEAKRRTMRDLLERYRETELPKKRDQRNGNRYLDFWIDEIGDYKVAAVTRAQIVEIRDRMVETRAPATVNRYLAALRHAFRVATTDWEWASKSPCSRLALREPRGRDRHLDDDEIAALRKSARASKHPHLNAIVLIALTTGARRGEIMRLTWPDVDLANGRAVFRETKNTDKRMVAFVPPVVAELRKLRKVRRIDSDRIFENPNNGKRTYSGFEDAWRTAREAAGLEDFRFHDLRHTFASRMAMDGRSLAEIAAALGHRTLAMVQRYSHLTESHVHAAMESTALKVLGD